MPSGRITPKQQEILDFLKKEILMKGYPPAVREICEAVHLKSTSSVHSHLETLSRVQLRLWMIHLIISEQRRRSQVFRL